MTNFVKPFNDCASKNIFIPVKILNGKIIKYDNDYQYLAWKDCKKLCDIRNKYLKDFNDGKWVVAKYGEPEIKLEEDE